MMAAIHMHVYITRKYLSNYTCTCTYIKIPKGPNTWYIQTVVRTNVLVRNRTTHTHRDHWCQAL